jgi:hypothetical protein
MLRDTCHLDVQKCMIVRNLLHVPRMCFKFQMDHSQHCTQPVFYKIDLFTNPTLEIKTVKLCYSRTDDTGRNYVLRLRVFA